MKEISFSLRHTHPVRVGSVVIGGDAPVVIQSMTNVNTNDVDAGVAQTLALVDAGCQLVRFTTQGIREVQSLARVHALLREKGCQVPLSADVHFNPKVAYEAARVVEKVRINPGNFYDPARKFRHLEYTDEEYLAEVTEMQHSFEDFLSHCQAHGVAIRIGVNHGSLSDRIMSRYGDTPAGMVESCMEFLRVCQRTGFDDVVISIKASNPLVMTSTVRLLCDTMREEGMTYPLHLGVTEAGEGEDGRIKSAVGIGSLLADGIGDTIRVSLSEDPTEEIPVARMILDAVKPIQEALPLSDPEGKVTAPNLYPGYTLPLVVVDHAPDSHMTDPDHMPDVILSGDTHYRVFTDKQLLRDPSAVLELSPDTLCLVSLTHPNVPAVLDILSRTLTIPFIASLRRDIAGDRLAVEVSVLLGKSLLEGHCAGIHLQSSRASADELNALSFRLLQACRRRITKTEYISCPGCGRTLFDLRETVARVKAATSHLKGLKIGVMGCIVNGPGEMADADYGYVGAARGKIDLFKGKECIKRGIPDTQAVDELIALIRANGNWVDPQ